MFEYLSDLVGALAQPLGAFVSFLLLVFLLAGCLGGIAGVIGAIRSGDKNLGRRFSNAAWALYAPEAADKISGLRK